jgi:hypothetical protein
MGIVWFVCDICDEMGNDCSGGIKQIVFQNTDEVKEVAMCRDCSDAFTWKYKEHWNESTWCYHNIPMPRIRLRIRPQYLLF